VVGSANVDLKLSLERLARPGETLLARGAAREPGGKGLNQAVAARRAGATVRFIGVSGADDAGRMLRTFLLGEGIDVREFRTDANETTGSAVVSLTDDGENSIVVVAGSNGAVTPHFVEGALATVEPGDIVLLQLEIPVETVRAAASVARRRGAVTVLNAAPFHPAILDFLDEVDVLVVNESEMIDLARAAGSSEADPRKAANILSRDLGVTIVCTLGIDGAIVETGSETVVQPALVVSAIDTTAAGDTFVGFLARALLSNASWALALSSSNAASAITVTRRGSAESIPYLVEVAG
jgi:ribokinase